MRSTVSIVTGAGRGIGLEIAQLFCEEGGKVLLIDQNEAALIAAERSIKAAVPHAEVDTLRCDVSRFDEAVRAVKHCVARFSSLTNLVCNAAVRSPLSFEDSTEDTWKAIHDVNVLGIAGFCKASMDELGKSGSGSIVIVSSCFAVKGRTNMPIYDASKAAALSLTRSIACIAAPKKVRVNAVCPGGTLTPFTIEVNKGRGVDEAQMRSAHRDDSLLHRWAEPREVAYPVLWLASKEASYITGTTLMVDGGLHII